jgi:hypothetical protein
LGYVQRCYASCADDGTTDSRAADLCWAGNNATLSLNGQSGRLVRDSQDSTMWRLADDPGWKIDKLTGTNANGDNDNEYWRVTDQRGWRYYFGIGTDADGQATGAVSYVPVYGNNAGEPCYSSTVSSSWCQQAWRWNLDRIIDPHGVQVSVHYDQELNRYGRQGSSSNATFYVRASQPNQIDYAQDSGSTTARRRIELITTGRCAAIPAACPSSTPANDDVYPDTPLDLQCDAAPCDEHSPTFFTARRLSEIDTRAWDGSSYRLLDVVELTHVFVDPDPGTTADDQNWALWLGSVKHTGYYSPSAGFASLDSGLAMPSTYFSYQRLTNRVDTGGGSLALQLPRIDQVRDELDARQ